MVVNMSAGSFFAAKATKALSVKISVQPANFLRPLRLPNWCWQQSSVLGQLPTAYAVSLSRQVGLAQAEDIAEFELQIPRLAG